MMWALRKIDTKLANQEASSGYSIETPLVRIAKAIFPILDPDSYLKHVTGVIHVGANLGQERKLYAKYKCKVLWIEPLPDIFEQLCNNIRSFPDQSAVNYLITDKDDVEYLFYVASN